ncbi:MAG: hypothetical protein OEZ02_12750, partial [Anaerolineae bacterium]|nr:hypothetical protein [Anaerolineae bacterium]
WVNMGLWVCRNHGCPLGFSDMAESNDTGDFQNISLSWSLAKDMQGPQRLKLHLLRLFYLSLLL